jgi:hypothetical protein
MQVTWSNQNQFNKRLLQLEDLEQQRINQWIGLMQNQNLNPRDAHQQVTNLGFTKLRGKQFEAHFGEVTRVSFVWDGNSIELQQIGHT